MTSDDRGHRETEHTADVKLEVWGQDMTALLEEAARGMYDLMAVEVAEESRSHHHIEIQADDREQLLVSFLEELLFAIESRRVAFDGYLLRVESSRLSAHLEGGEIVSSGRDIKAVTYHDLEITEDENGLRTHIVFDV